MINIINWPEGKKFAFTVFDDTDNSTVHNVPVVYELLKECGYRTTKSVWPLRGNEEPRIGGATCEDPDYLEWVMNLKGMGFEIGYHNATFHSSFREQSINGVERFYELFGYYPKTMANHAECRDSMYWGIHRLTGISKHIYRLLTMNRYNGLFQGHMEGSKYFWGDICKNKIKYVRNFVFSEINTLKVCPIMPYHDPSKPLVNYWFSSSEGPNVQAFNRCISEQNQDRLEEEGGACIMYTHFADGFCDNGKIDSRFKFLMKRLSAKNGWFVPVSDLLDYLLEIRGRHHISDKERNRLERKWLLHKIRVGAT